MSRCHAAPGPHPHHRRPPVRRADHDPYQRRSDVAQRVAESCASDAFCSMPPSGHVTVTISRRVGVGERRRSRRSSLSVAPRANEAEGGVHCDLDPWSRPLLGPLSCVQSLLLATPHAPELFDWMRADTIGARDQCYSNNLICLSGDGTFIV
jgi:hypothetical protein